MQPLNLSAAQLAEAVRARKISARESVDATLDAIARIDGQLNAFCTVAADQARRDAAAIDERISMGDTVGPLVGVPVAIKDLVCTKGIRSTFGSKLYADHVPDEDDVVVERLKAAGAIVVGKTNASEFGYGALGHNPVFPTTRNPWNTAMTPGGSSAGSGAALAAHMLPLASGSDGGGSVRVPAALCGVFGLKPSWGRVPVYPGCRDQRYPGISSWESLEHIGPMTRTVADAALMMSVLCGPTPRDRFSIPTESNDWSLPAPSKFSGIRIAYSPDLGFATVDPQVRRITQAAVEKIADALGASVEIAHPGTGDPGAMFETLVAMDTDRAGLRRMAQEQGVTLGGWLSRLLAREWTADEFTWALMERKRIVNAAWRFMDRFDFFLTPTTGTPAFPVDTEGPTHIDGKPVHSAAWIPFSSLANLTGLPASSVPIGFTDEGLPLGLQIMGRHLDDRGVLGLSAAVENIFSTPQRAEVSAL
jgi:aspartyl-tRNA(Asn)/glutamyl-tRNA(Gln) amidotransferase subunit A